MRITLENLSEEVRKNRLRNLAANIVKYQNFKTNAIIPKIDNAGYSDNTLRFYIEKGINYIKNGSNCRQLGSFTCYIDECIEQHIQPLVPKESEKRRLLPIRKMQKAKTVEKNEANSDNPVQRVLNRIVIDSKPYDYAVKMNNNIRILNTQEEAKAFLEGLSFMGATDAKVIKVIVEEIKG